MWLWIFMGAALLLVLLATAVIAFIVRAERRTRNGFRDLQARVEATADREKEAARRQMDEAMRLMPRDPTVTSLGVNFDERFDHMAGPGHV